MTSTRTRNTGRTRRTSAQVREDRAAESARLRDAFEAWRDSHTPEEIAMLTASIRGYSDRNAALIAMQCPYATEVRGFNAWHDYGRKVRRGEKAIRVLAPAGHSGGDTVTEQGEPVKGGEPERRFFRYAPVFDISQTDPLPDTDRAGE